MKKIVSYFIFVGSMALVGASNAEIINQIPQNVSCTVSGTGSGLCRIIFPAGTIGSCPNDTQVIFDPQSGTLGKQIYSMVLVAIASGRALQISLLPTCHPLGPAMIDWIVM